MENRNFWIFGSTSTIIAPIIKKFPKAKLINRSSKFYRDPKSIYEEIIDTEDLNIIYNSAMLCSKMAFEQNDKYIIEALFVNVVRFVQLIEMLNQEKKQFNAIFISSESAKKGSFDTTYWMSKNFGEQFVREVKLKNINSSIIALSPSTILDSQMTKSRKDIDLLDQYRKAHPKQRFLSSEEVSFMILKLIEAPDYLTNTIIEMNGGKFARR
jgi:hypothetical protein|tara:strand:+ start:3280 stop:3915 length:636 start_codon:yes stop_codon:yes gene_type:complete